MGWAGTWRLRGRLLAAAGTAMVMLVAGACSTPMPQQGGEEDGAFTIGVSNGFVGSEWRTQMIEDIRRVFEQYKKKGVVGELVIESADVDVNGQIKQVRNLINAGVDAIIINPNSQSALNAVFKEAERRGVTVVATDQAVTSSTVTNVVIDHAEWGRKAATWLADKLGSGADIAAINGIDGHPANEARWGAAKKVFDEAGINVAAVGYGKWDQATGQQVMSNLLASHPDIDGVWVQDGMALGVFQAIQGAGKLDEIVMTGEARVGFMRNWAKQRSRSDFESVGVVNPPGAAGSALHMTIRLLQGKKLDPSKVENGNTVYLPIPKVVTEENFERVWARVKGKPNSYCLDGIMSPTKADSYFR